MSLTGRTRYRVAKESVGFFGRREVIVLQVEERQLHTSCTGGGIDVDVVLVWRDAQVTDISIAVGSTSNDG